MDQEIIGNKAAATYLGIQLSTWRSYVARGQAPPPTRRQIVGSHAVPVWPQKTLDEWRNTRRPRT